MAFSMDDKGQKGNHAVFGIFNDRATLERAVDILKSNDFRNSDISVLMQSNKLTQDFAHEKNTKAPEGATTGATAGVFAGGILGWLVGAGTLAIPGIGPFVAAGPIMAAIAGGGIGGAIGGIAGALIGMGIPEYEAKRYETNVKNGGMLLSVHTDDSTWAEKAENLLKASGAHDVACALEKSEEEEEKVDMSKTQYTKPTSVQDDYNSFPGI